MSPSFYNYSGLYAGYFNGKVRVTNGIYATVLSPTASASSNGQNEATILSDRGESVTDKLSKVQAVQFLRYDPTEEVGTRRNASVPSDEEIDKMSPLQLDSLAATLEAEEPERYLSTIQYGLDVDQLKAVYPELVYEDANGNVSINYVEMVPLLVQSINELKKELAEMKGTSAKKAKAETTGIDKTVSDIDMVRMDQNKPNPFSESTVIALNIPQEAQTANIYIYDMSGKQVQSLSVSERGETNITVYASDITPGMYIYTLVVDGKVAVTRRMIVSEI
ncbi:MAG: T9SS type A sorting domain-containing protein [Bacteroidaceae bacterium]|nr:T9SS type A sorting domain-containing protein [Bacteroidaceae bacterium]